MKIRVNGAWREVLDSGAAAATLEALLHRFGFGNATVATAVNGEFVPHGARGRCLVQEGDRIEVLAPMQGG